MGFEPIVECRECDESLEVYLDYEHRYCECCAENLGINIHGSQHPSKGNASQEGQKSAPRIAHIVVPSGYANAEDFAKDGDFELAPSSPSGWKLVPLAMNGDMIAAFRDEFYRDEKHFDYIRIYEAILNAAPKPPHE